MYISRNSQMEPEEDPYEQEQNAQQQQSLWPQQQKQLQLIASRIVTTRTAQGISTFTVSDPPFNRKLAIPGREYRQAGPPMEVVNLSAYYYVPEQQVHIMEEMRPRFIYIRTGTF